MKYLKLRYLLLLFSLIAVFHPNVSFAEEEVYPYTFIQDTTLVGKVVADGNIYKEDEITFVSIFNNLYHENRPPALIFYDESFKIVEQINLTSPQCSILSDIKVFDFDNDSLDEVIFTIRDAHKLSFVYFDPSNKPIIRKTFFEIPIKGVHIYLRANLTPIQLDDDSFFEILITSSDNTIRKYLKPGIWAVDIEQSKLLWEKCLVASPVKTDPIIFSPNKKPNIIYSTYSNNSKKFDLFYSNKYFHFINKFDGTSLVYDKFFNENKNVVLDTTSEDYAANSTSYLASLNTSGNLNWKIILDSYPKDLFLYDLNYILKKKLLLSNTKLNETKIKIIDSETGTIDNEIKLKNRYKLALEKNNILIFKTGHIYSLDLNFNKIDSAETTFQTKYLACMPLNKQDFRLFIEGANIVQTINAYDAKLNKMANIKIRGPISYLKNSKLISVINTANRTTKLFSLKAIPWYQQITVDTLRTLAFSFLIILTFFMLLWVSTLRVSSKKIKRQKDELEKSHLELKETTDKLIEAEKLAVYGTIAGSIAHEINSPLGAIINSAQRLLKDKNVDVKKNIELIEKAGKRSQSIIEKLLLGTPRPIIDSSSNLNYVLNDWRELSVKQFDNLGITIETEIECNNMIAISSTELNQVITNIMSNARDSIMEKNEPLKKIFIKCSRINQNCLITIRDTGTGFSSTMLENPFKAFKTSKKRGEGTGLGLWVIKQILDKVGGEIKIQNCDVGAKIEIIIPLFLENVND